MRKHPDRAADIAQSFDHKQVECKSWLINELKKINIKPNVFLYIAGAWYGNILVPLLRQIYSKKICIKMHDIDYKSVDIAKRFFKYDNLIKSDVVNSEDFLYNDFLINTSCEHMKPLRIEQNTYVAFQSNNYRQIEEHINCVDSCEELISQYNLKEIYFQGAKQFEKYKRFMIIGKT